MEDLEEVQEYYNGDPLKYSAEAISAFKKILPETKQQLKEFCEIITPLKPSLIEIIEIRKNKLLAAKDALEKGEKLKLESDDFQDELDSIENIIETTEKSIKESEDELKKLEKSLIRYGSN